MSDELFCADSDVAVLPAPADTTTGYPALLDIAFQLQVIHCFILCEGVKRRWQRVSDGPGVFPSVCESGLWTST